MAPLLTHGKAHFLYEIMDRYEAGIELLGFEVKSIRAHQGSLLGAHVIIRGGEAYVIGMDIPPYQKKNTPNDYESLRTRRLLLTKTEIEKLAKGGETKGLTIIPISLYNKGSKIKVEIAIVRGKKAHDKRNVIKARDTDREMRRTLKSN